jgi:hypothetical protein
MNQKLKNITLMVILGVLVACSVILGVTKKTGSATIENAGMFAIQDTARIDKITMRSDGETMALQKVDGVWRLNDQYKAEQNIARVLLAILKDAQVVRKVPKSQAETLAGEVMAKGVLVEISGEGKLLGSFYAAGNDNKTVSYMMATEASQPMIVNIPGYESYVAGIFEIPQNDWRDRTILSANWRTLQKLDMQYRQFPEYDFTIEFKFNFLSIDGIDLLDTARMMDYIEQFNFLQADRFLDRGQNEKYDSLLRTPETVSLSISDINAANSRTILFYPLLPDDAMMLGYVKEDDQMALFQASRIQSWFAIREEFMAKEDGE